MQLAPRGVATLGADLPCGSTLGIRTAVGGVRPEAVTTQLGPAWNNTERPVVHTHGGDRGPQGGMGVNNPRNRHKACPFTHTASFEKLISLICKRDYIMRLQTWQFIVNDVE